MWALTGVPIEFSTSGSPLRHVLRQCRKDNRCGSTKEPTSPEYETGRCEPSGHLERAVLAAFQRDLLGKHNISDRQITTRHETQAARRAPLFVDFADVRRRARVDPILPASLATDDLEIAFSRELRTLDRREPLPQELQRAALRSSLGAVSDEESLNGSRAPAFTRAR